MAKDERVALRDISIGDVEGKKAILIDDILNTGRTFSEAAKIVCHEAQSKSMLYPVMVSLRIKLRNY